VNGCTLPGADSSEHLYTKLGCFSQIGIIRANKLRLLVQDTKNHPRKDGSKFSFFILRSRRFL